MVTTSLLDGLKGLWPGRDRYSSPVPPESLPAERLADVLAASHALRDQLARLAEAGRTPVDLVLNGRPFALWTMYPRNGGVLDERSASQYFYHAHADYSGEHGHFHTFVYDRRRLVHLVAIGMRADGRPNALYTFNRWGPDDTYLPAHALCALLPRFAMGEVPGADPELSAFLNGMLRAFAPQIEWLFGRRDETFATYRFRHGGAEPFEDRSLEITSHLPIDLDGHIRQLERAARRTRGTDLRRPETVADEPADSGDAGAAPVYPTPPAERPRADLRSSHRAGTRLCSLLDELQAQGASLIDLVMGDQSLEPWRMYPWEGGVIDRERGCQYFYHAHPQSPEHGHFHLFRRRGGALTHLVAVSLDARGQPFELFTVNRWVTGDVQRPAGETAGLLAGFRPHGRRPDARLNRFLRDLVVLYRQEIAALLAERDRCYESYRARHGGLSPDEDRGLEVTSAMHIDIRSHTEALAAALEQGWSPGPADGGPPVA